MRATFQRVGQYLRVHWRIVTTIVLGTLAVCLLMLFRLGSITGGLSANEVTMQQFSSSWHHILHNPLTAPLTVVQWVILTVIPHHGNTVTRAASPIFGVLAVAAFAYVLRRWYGVRTAIYGTALFGLSSWLLHVSRYAGPDVLYLWAMPSLLATGIAMERHHTKARMTYLAISIFAVLLYIPGLMWLIIAGLALQHHLVVNAWKSLATLSQRLIAAGIAVLLLTPLCIALVKTPSLIQTWLGLPATIGSVDSIGRGILHSVSFFVYKGPNTPELWLVRAPILSFFGMVMALLGVLFYAKHWQAPRTRLLLAYGAIGALLFALGGPVTISLLVPIAYLLIAAGFGYLLHEWLQVFPKNPLARSIGFSLLGLLVILACAYELRSYYVAWPHNPATIEAFHKHR